MKKLLFLLLLFSTFFGYAQYTAIPDVNFEKALIGLGRDSGSPDGKVLTANIKSLTQLNITYLGITDLTGIEDFEGLTSLVCHHNNLTFLNLNNPLLQTLFCLNNQLTSLNVSKCLALNNLWCSSNQLISVDLSKNTALELLYCNDNKLTNLDLTKNTLLNQILCSDNQLISLDIAENKVLTSLNCFNNQLVSLDASNNPILEILSCYSNNLLSLNLKNTNNTKFNYFDFTKNPNLTCIQVDNKSYSDTNWSTKKDATASFSEDCSKIAPITPPVITATGNQIYCPGTALKVVETINITFDPAEPTTDAVYIQISSGYVSGQDFLTLAGIHPNVSSNWSQLEGKLNLYSTTGNKIPYSDFEEAIKDVTFKSNSSSLSGTRTFSISLGTGSLSYLPSNGHYYEYVSSSGINWTRAKNEASTKKYYGLEGYLATLTTSDEAQLAGAQSPGTGWIGGSDAETEGDWKWVTGPEAGISFWLGKNNGTTTSPFYFANWNSPIEPNDSNNNEDYAHITSTAVGFPGTWNDLSEQGDPPGDYYPNGYIVEYGGMAGDPVLKISASTTMTMSQLTVATPDAICFGEKTTLQASASTGTINWYDKPTGGALLQTGTSFTTPALTTDTTYYVDNGCPTRLPITVTVNAIPTITNTNTPVSLCGAGAVTLQAIATSGTINWYASKTGSTVVATGTSFPIPNITANATYYSEAFNSGCSDGNRVQVDIFVYTPPVVVNQEVTKCKSSNIELDAGVPGMFYSWSTGEKTQKITVLASGIYFVDVTSPAPENCSSTKKITVFEYDTPEIDRIDVKETTVVIYVKKEEPYFEYSVDGINYQNSNVFFNVQGGLQTAYVRETNLCSNDSQTFSILIVPKYFTPNGDTYNDYWEVKGLNNYPKAEVSIFDRYGKLISVLNATKTNWDGMLNKNPLPSDDYWYVLRIDENSPEKRGHFSLKR